MKMIFKVSKGGLPLIPEGEYNAVFAGHEVLEGLKFGDAVKLMFEVDEGPHSGTILDMLANAKLTTRSKFGLVVTVIQGKPLKEDQEIDLEALEGSPCRIKVITVKDDYGGEFSTIEQVKAR